MGNQSRAKVYEQNAAAGGGGAIEVGGVDGTGSTICELGGCIEDHFMEPMVIDISSAARHAYEEAQQKNREMGNQSQVPAPIDRKTPPKTHRQIGFQRPFSKDQIRAWIVHGINYSVCIVLSQPMREECFNSFSFHRPSCFMHWQVCCFKLERTIRIEQRRFL